MTNIKTFEDFLAEKHAEDYQGFEEEMSYAFDNWLTELQIDDVIKYADEYLIKVLTQQKEDTINEMIKLSDKIEAENETPDINEWKAFKHFRNTMRDKLKN